MTRPRVVPVGDGCLSLVFDERIDAGINARCIAIAASLERREIPGLRDIVPTYNAVAVHFDARRIDRRALEADLGRVADIETPGDAADAALVRIPVEYGGEHGVDLAAVAEFGGCSEEDVIRLHTAGVYRVYMLGFLPGFAYMGTVDARIAMPRLSAPRMRVAGGSVGIAGAQTGVYPCDTPGGWRIIGRALTKVFDQTRADPFLLKAGDQVQFVIA